MTVEKDNDLQRDLDSVFRNQRDFELEIQNELAAKFDDGRRQGFALTDSHFENGASLHGSQYYFAKRYFQDSDNCEKLANLLCSRFVNAIATSKRSDDRKKPSVGLKKPTTLVGYRNYSAMVLSRAVLKLRDLFEGTKYASELNYAILEGDGDSFTWQYQPSLNEELVIVLPISCTCSTFFRMRRFLQERPPAARGGQSVQVKKDFLVFFLILDESLRDPAVMDSYNRRFGNVVVPGTKEARLSKLYEPFNWNEIKSESVQISTQKANELKMTPYVAHPIVRLHSVLHLPEECPHCFPGPGENELPLIPTHDNYETPNLIFGFPNFAPTLNVRSFSDTFLGGAHHQIQFHRDISVDGTLFSSFIRGNALYNKERQPILDFFDEEIRQRLNPDDDAVVFITCENKHSSDFLEDISKRSTLRNRKVTILRFLPSNEFIDNFISLHSRVITNPKTRVFYFEEVMSGAKTFKLLSNYIKHARRASMNEVRFWKDNPNHGFDLVLSLVDRMLPYTRNEVDKKLYSELNVREEDHQISYFKLNVPILHASHMDDGSEAHKKQLEEMIERSNLDCFKINIGRRIAKVLPAQLPQLTDQKLDERPVEYFAFGRLLDEQDRERFDLYKPYVNRAQLNLLHLHVVHELNNVLALPAYVDTDLLYSEPYRTNPGTFIEELISEVQTSLADELDKYFIDPTRIETSGGYRNKDAEREIVHAIVVKSLSLPRFIYYQTVFRPIFHYVVGRLRGIVEGLPDGKIRDFPTLRKVKFYLRRSVDLNSNYMFSEQFIEFVKSVSDIDYIDDTIRSLESLGEHFNKSYSPPDGDEDSSNFKAAVLNNISYRINEIQSFFPDLYDYYKELLAKNPARSLRLESLLNDAKVLQTEMRIDGTDDRRDVSGLIGNPYIQFIEMVRTENTYPFIDLVNLHKRTIAEGEAKIAGWDQDIRYAENQVDELVRQVGDAGDLAQIAKHRDEIVTKRHSITETEKDSADAEKIHTNYFGQLRNDPNILRAHRLTDRTSYGDGGDYIRLAISRALATVGLLQRKRRKTYEKIGLNAELKEILDSTLRILDPHGSDGSLSYILFVEHRRRPKTEAGFSEFYTYVRDEHDKAPSDIRLSNDGLIFNLLNGLYGERTVRFSDGAGQVTMPQTLIAGAKLDRGDFVSFKSDYYLRDGTHIPFSQICEADLPKNKVGIAALEDATLFLALRLATLNPPQSSSGEYSLDGRAVLLITSSTAATPQGFVQFFNSEKIRLLFLIKHDLLQYIERQLENEVFLNQIEIRKEAALKRHLRHGLRPYLTVQQGVVSSIRRHFEELDDPGLLETFKDRFDLYSLVKDAILGQLNFSKPDDPMTVRTLNKELIADIVRLLFPSGTIGRWSIDPNDLDLSEFNPVEADLPESIVTVVIPELLVNMKKHCPRAGYKDLSISYDGKESRLAFTNRKKATSDDGSHVGQGLDMCDAILTSLGLPKLGRKDGGTHFSVYLYLKK